MDARAPHHTGAAARRLAGIVAIAATVAVLTGCGATGAPAGEVVEFEVAAQRVPCVGEAEMACLQIRRDGEGDWQLFYDDIAGFTFEDGTAYTLRVEVTPVEDPPADGSSFAYTLVEVVEQGPAATG